MKWQIYPKIDEKIIGEFPQYSPFVLQLLANRDITAQEAIDEFFNSDFLGDMHDPFLMKGVGEAVDYLEQAISGSKKMAIWGDYDADGVCGTLILKSALVALGAQVITYIPDREKEGYGLNIKGLKEIKEAGVELLITVDCGITNLEGVAMAKSMGIEVIVTDHHRIVEGNLPKIDIIIDPYQADDNYPFKPLAGAGVAYKLVCALLKNKKLAGEYEALEKWLLDLVAIATIADHMPLLGENRTLVKYGLIVLNQTRRPGLKELVRQSNFSKRGVGPMGAVDVAFVLAPRLNAAGRMDHANMAYELLSTSLAEEAGWLAQRLCQLNYERQTVVEKLVKEVEKTLEKTKLIFTGGVKWPTGVLSLIAGKLSNKYHRPVIIFNQNEEGVRGSCRSLGNFNIVKALESCSSLLTRFGGHPYAAGFSLKSENLEQFKSCMLKMGEEINEGDLTPVLEIDSEIDAEEVSWQTYEQILPFSPFGFGNQEPVFLIRRLEIKEIKMVGNGGKHSKLVLASSSISRPLKAIAFNFSSEISKMKVGDRIDVVFEMLANEWNGLRELQIKVIDLKISE